MHQDHLSLTCFSKDTFIGEARQGTSLLAIAAIFNDSATQDNEPLAIIKFPLELHSGKVVDSQVQQFFEDSELMSSQSSWFDPLFISICHSAPSFFCLFFVC